MSYKLEAFLTNWLLILLIKEFFTQVAILEIIADLDRVLLRKRHPDTKNFRRLVTGGITCDLHGTLVESMGKIKLMCLSCSFSLHNLDRFESKLKIPLGKRLVI